MKVKAKLSGGGIGELNRTGLTKRFQECVRFQRLATQLQCSLDYVEHLISAPTPVALARKGLRDAQWAAKKIKEEFWVPEDKKAHVLMKQTAALLRRVEENPEGPARARIMKSLQGLHPKVKEVLKAREDSSCGIRFYETVNVDRSF